MARPRFFVFCLVVALIRAEEEARISYEGAQLLRVEAPSTHDKDEILKLADIGVLDTWSAVAQNDSQIDVFVKADAELKVKQFLNENNLTFEVVIENVQKAIDTESPPLTEEEMEELVGRNGHRMTWQAYHRLDDIYGYLDYMAASFPSVSVQTIGTSVEGRPLKVLSISSGKPGAPAMWIDGGVHAREWISPASVTYIINELVENQSSLDPAVKGVDFHILAVANPDGYEHSREKDRLWRKNRGNKAQGACAGVDLNRNFGYKWGGPGSSRQPCKEIYAGSNAFSEPETKAMSSFVLAKSLKNELKAKDSQLSASTKQKMLSSTHTSIVQENENQSLREAVKNKEELIVQLNLEVESLKNDKQELDKSAKSLKSTNSLLLAELEKHKQLSGNVVKPISASNKTTIAVKKELDQLKIDFEKKTSEVKVVTSELENVKGELESKKTAMVAVVTANKQKVEALEIKLGEVQAMLEKENSTKKDDKKQREADVNRIQDLNRQVKEMERILKRNHPNSISALILTANSGEASLGTNPRIKYLENRIEQLEKELETKQIEMEGSIKTIEQQYQTMKEKYDIHTADITSELATWKHDSNYWKEIAEKNRTEVNSWKGIADNAKADASVWKDTAEKNTAEAKLWKEKAEVHNRPSSPIITDLGKRVLSMEDLATPQETLPRNQMPIANKSQSSSGVSSKLPSTLGSLRSQPCQQQLPHRMSSNVQVVREEAHLLATIRGLKAELAGRDKTIRVLEKKLDETTKTNKRLQRERENLLNRDALFRPPKVPTTSKVDFKETKHNHEAKEMDSDVDNNSYSVAHYQALSNMEEKVTALKRKNRESEVQIRLLSGELSKLNDKRLQDLEDLQEEHNTEMARVLSENSSRNSGSQISQLKAKISSQDQAITVLRKYLSQSGELQDEIVVLKAERDHLESCLNDANKKLANLKDAQSPEQQHYENLREQMKELEKRHECREQRLQAIIRDLIHRNNTQHRPTTSDSAIQGNSEVETLRKKLLERDLQVMQYKEELDVIIEKVHEYERLTNEHCNCTHKQPSRGVSE